MFGECFFHIFMPWAISLYLSDKEAESIFNENSNQHFVVPNFAHIIIPEFFAGWGKTPKHNYPVRSISASITFISLLK
jgi:hypothetical protein